MPVSRRVRKKPPKSVRSEALEQEHLRLMEEHKALMRDFRTMVREVSALASCVKERSSVGGRTKDWA